jgi:hypothetical protein
MRAAEQRQLASLRHLFISDWLRTHGLRIDPRRLLNVCPRINSRMGTLVSANISGHSLDPPAPTFF